MQKMAAMAKCSLVLFLGLCASFLPSLGLHCQRPASTAFLRCSEAYGDVSRIRWKRQGINGWLEDRGRVYLLGNGGMLLVGLEANDSGVYEAWLPGTLPQRLCKQFLWVSPNGVCRTTLKLSGKRKIIIRSGSTACFSSQLETDKPSYVPFDVETTIVHFNMTSQGPQHELSDSKRVTGTRSLNVCIHNVSLYDSGTYTVYAISDTGTADRKIRLKVREATTIREKPQAMDLPVAGMGTLSCTARGSPISSISWYKDGKRLTKLSSSHKQVSAMIGKQQATMSFSVDRRHFESSSTLHLSNFSVNQVGKYRCVAHNGGRFGGTDMAETYVHLLKGPEQRTIGGFRQQKAPNPLSLKAQ